MTDFLRILFKWGAIFCFVILATISILIANRMENWTVSEFIRIAEGTPRIAGKRPAIMPDSLKSKAIGNIFDNPNERIIFVGDVNDPQYANFDTSKWPEKFAVIYHADTLAVFDRYSLTPKKIFVTSKQTGKILDVALGNGYITIQYEFAMAIQDYTADKRFSGPDDRMWE